MQKLIGKEENSRVELSLIHRFSLCSNTLMTKKVSPFWGRLFEQHNMSLSAAFALWGRSRNTWRLGPGVTEGKTAGGCIMCLASQRDLGFKQTGSFLEPGLPLSLWTYWLIVPLPIGWVFKIPTVSYVCPVDFLLYFAWSETVLSTTLVSSRLCLLSSDATKCRLWDVTPSNAETENVVVCFNRFACVLPQWYLVMQLCGRRVTFVKMVWELDLQPEFLLELIVDELLCCCPEVLFTQSQTMVHRWWCCWDSFTYPRKALRIRRVTDATYHLYPCTIVLDVDRTRTTQCEFFYMQSSDLVKRTILHVTYFEGCGWSNTTPGWLGKPVPIGSCWWMVLGSKMDG